MRSRASYDTSGSSTDATRSKRNGGAARDGLTALSAARREGCALRLMRTSPDTSWSGPSMRRTLGTYGIRQARRTQMYIGVVHTITNKATWAKKLEEFETAPLPDGYANPISYIG